MRARWMLGVMWMMSGCCDGWGAASSLAGPDATNCGLVPIDGDRAAALDCAELADAEGRAFVVGWESVGRDAIITYYGARDADGNRWSLAYGPFGHGDLLQYECAGPFERIDHGRPIGETLSCPAEASTVLCD